MLPRALWIAVDLARRITVLGPRLSERVVRSVCESRTLLVVSARAVVEAMVDQGRMRVSAAQIIARLAAASQKLDEAKAKTAAAAQDAAEARALVAGALEGVAAGPLVGMIDATVSSRRRLRAVTRPSSTSRRRLPRFERGN
ncbi:hypothetical protein GCM10027614_25420 [Micromonospora vulcania]